MGTEWVTNRRETLQSSLAGVEESGEKSLEKSFFHLSAFWRGTKCHHQLAGVSLSSQGSANTPGLAPLLSAGLCLWRGWGLSSPRSSLLQMFCRRTDLQSDFPVSKCTWWKAGTVSSQDFSVWITALWQGRTCCRKKWQEKSTISYPRSRGHETLLILHLTVAEEQYC